MTIHDLSPEEYLELCQRCITEFWFDGEDGTTSPSYQDLATANELVDRDVIENYYCGVEFVKEDFFCNIKSEERVML